MIFIDPAFMTPAIAAGYKPLLGLQCPSIEPLRVGNGRLCGLKKLLA